MLYWASCNFSKLSLAVNSNTLSTKILLLSACKDIEESGTIFLSLFCKRNYYVYTGLSLYYRRGYYYEQRRIAGIEGRS